jgi:hypothetical protein
VIALPELLRLEIRRCRTGSAMKLIDVERIIRRGAGSLAESLHFYWPSTGNNEVPESNIALHLGRAFMDEGFLAYSNAHTKDDVKVHLDLMAMQPRAQILVAGEFKRIYNSDQVRKLVDDLTRILKFRPQDDAQLRHAGLNVGESFGLLAGTTHNEKYAHWFATDETNIGDETGGHLDGLWQQLRRADPIYNAYPLSDYWFGGVRHTHWLLYVLFRIA